MGHVHHQHDHDHDHDHAHVHEASESNLKRVMIALVLTGTFMFVEIVGGILSGSLALLADAGHMASDVAALALASGGDVTSDRVGIALTVAVVHLLFNIFGIVIIYPVKAVPIRLARWLARTMTRSRGRAVLFLLLFFLANAVPFVLLMVL